MKLRQYRRIWAWKTVHIARLNTWRKKARANAAAYWRSLDREAC